RDIDDKGLRNMDWWGSQAAALSTEDLFIDQCGTLTEVPTALTHAVNEAREAVVGHIFWSFGDADSLLGWHFLLCFDRLLFGELRRDAEDSTKTVRERVAERLDMFWAGEWDQLMCLTSARVKTRSAQKGLSKTAQRIRYLLHKGELGRACQAAWGTVKTRDVGTTRQAFLTQQGLGENARLNRARSLAADVSTHLMGNWSRVPRGAGSGPLGDRFEHWLPLAHAGMSGENTAQVLGDLCIGSVPSEAKDLLLAGRLLGIANRDAGTRAVASGTVPRRVIGQAVCATRKAEIRSAVGPYQHGVLEPGGAEALQKTITAHAESRPDWAFISAGVRSAFRRLRRRRLFRALRTQRPDLELLARSIYDRGGVHAVAGEGEASSTVVQWLGLDEGCPLSLALWGVFLAGPLDELNAQLRTLHVEAKAVAFLDDVYLRVPRACASTALRLATELLANTGFEVHVGETKAFALLRNFVNGSTTYAQRARPGAPETWRLTTTGSSIPWATSRAVQFLPVREGGGGFSSAEQRADPATLGSWSTAWRAVLAAQGLSTLDESERAAPGFHAVPAQARQRTGTRRCAGGGPSQRYLTRSAQARGRRQPGQAIDPEGASLLRSQGAEGGAWLQVPRRDEHTLADDEFCAAYRRRLLFEDPARQGGAPCQRRSRQTGHPCALVARQRYGSHACCCDKGPGFCSRGNRCRDALAARCKREWGEEEALTEQACPRWNRVRAGGTMERADLDVVLPHDPVSSGPLAIDVSAVEVTTPDPGLAAARSRRDGQAAADRERTKHQRYPGGGLLAAALETGGRWGSEFRRWAKAAAPEGLRRAEALADLRQSLAAALQRGVAAQLLAGAAGPPRPRH
ncbi:unnamed protein product, partial [Prorocentrum cordatum]